MKPIKTISSILKSAFGLYLILIPFASIFFWILSGLFPWKATFIAAGLDQNMFDITIRSAEKIYSVWHLDLPWEARFIGLAGDLCQESFKWVAVLYVFCLMNLYAKGGIFSKRHAHYFKRIGQFLLGYATIGFTLGGALHSVAMTFYNPPGERVLSITVGSPNLEALVMASVITLIGWVTLEGFKLRSDQDLTI